MPFVNYIFSYIFSTTHTHTLFQRLSHKICQQFDWVKIEKIKILSSIARESVKIHVIKFSKLGGKDVKHFLKSCVWSPGAGESLGPLSRYASRQGTAGRKFSAGKRYETVVEGKRLRSWRDGECFDLDPAMREKARGPAWQSAPEPSGPGAGPGRVPRLTCRPHLPPRALTPLAAPARPRAPADTALGRPRSLPRSLSPAPARRPGSPSACPARRRRYPACSAPAQARPLRKRKMA